MVSPLGRYVPLLKIKFNISNMNMDGEIRGEIIINARNSQTLKTRKLIKY